MLTKSTIKGFVPPWAIAISRPPRRVLRRSRRMAWRAPAACWLLLAPLFLRMKRAYKAVRLMVRFSVAHHRYTRTGVVPADVDHLLADTYMLTNGRLTDFHSRRLARRFPPVPEPEGRKGVMPAMSAGEMDAVLADLHLDGVHIFKQPLDAAVCDQLVEFAHQNPCMLYGDHLKWGETRAFFDPKNPVATTYWFDSQTLNESAPVQRILTDTTLLKVAQRHLGMEPIVNIVTMWWSTAYKRVADSRSAQLYHFDLDRSRFLKVFVYLVDVNEENGPHVYLRGTQHRKVRPLLKDTRISDEEMYSHYPEERALTVTGLKGMVFIADTRGFHKGMPVINGTRLIFQLEYVCDRFGSPQPIIKLNEHFGAEFLACKQRHPRLFCSFSEDPAVKTSADLRIV